MAVVAIQLIGIMAANAYVNNARAANGGDISLSAGDPNAPIKQSDLAFFDKLKRVQIITNYTPVNIESGTIDQAPTPPLGLFVQIINPQHFPLVTAPTFVSPPLVR
ncbi:hypothetical protein KSZ_78630 [Dictyobacter formicarum]|uniref:Flp pilus-assembly TadG-like N-terminal domain-containing protein n=2 Tax=Dictyobacter formicarum TaxID=2778368 RepID=A0ABQ3VVD4_9CHLR|nr:hypothetical protein KSZ_78630 [Dictyobacter formicarum]